MSREDQRRLGDILQRVYDDVVKQGVPDRFKNLLQEIDERPEKPVTTGLPQSAGAEEPARRNEDVADEDAIAPRTAGARRAAGPGSSGSH